MLGEIGLGSFYAIEYDKELRRISEIEKLACNFARFLLPIAKSEIGGCVSVHISVLEGYDIGSVIPCVTTIYQPDHPPIILILGPSGISWCGTSELFVGVIDGQDVESQ